MSFGDANNFFCAVWGDLPLWEINNLWLLYIIQFVRREEYGEIITRNGREKWHFFIFLTVIWRLFLLIIANGNFLKNNEFHVKKMLSLRLSKIRPIFSDTFYSRTLRFGHKRAHRKKRNLEGEKKRYPERFFIAHIPPAIITPS